MNYDYKLILKRILPIIIVIIQINTNNSCILNPIWVHPTTHKIQTCDAKSIPPSKKKLKYFSLPYSLIFRKLSNVCDMMAYFSNLKHFFHPYTTCLLNSIYQNVISKLNIYMRHFKDTLLFLPLRFLNLQYLN